jgi:transcription antitermination factor NusG
MLDNDDSTIRIGDKVRIPMGMLVMWGTVLKIDGDQVKVAVRRGFLGKPINKVFNIVDVEKVV